MSDPSVGNFIAGRYEIKGEPKSFPGYTGYRAFDHEVEVEVALWWIRREMFPGPADRARFLRAAADARKMKNDNARRLFDAAEVGDFLYATVQLATGERLQDRIARGEKPSNQELLDYAAALCGALSRAHEVGLVHGRLVPQDVVTVSGLVKVGGIGLWHCASESARLLWARAARYVAPEAWTPGKLGPRSDVYSAAVILAELASGGGGALWERTGEVRELKDELALARADLATELTAALETDPARRVDTPTTLLATLRAALGAAPSAAAEAKELPTETLTAIAPRPTNGRSAEPPLISGVPDRGPTAEIAAIDREIEASEATAHYVRKSPPGSDPDDFPDTELIEPPKPVPRTRATPPPIPVAPPAPKPPERPPDVRKTGQELPMPLVAAPSKEFAVPPIQALVDASLPTTPFNRPVPLPPQTTPMAPRRRKVWPYVVVASAVAVGVALIAWVALNGLFGEDDEAAPAQTAAKSALPGEPAPRVAAKSARPDEPTPRAKPVVVAPAPPVQAGPCADGMAQVEGFCIDVYESPGAGRLPETGMTFAAAEKACAERGARLCEPDEWERACRGPKRWSFPYGSSYRRSKCNTDEGGKAEIGAAGSFDCASAEGVHDLSGNVAEWVAGARPRGGSASDGTDGRCSRKRKADPDGAHDDVGYRCCADAK